MKALTALRGPLALLALILALGGSGFVLLLQQHNSAQQRLEHARQQQQMQRQDHARRAAEDAELARLAQHERDWQAQGLLQPEPREAWLKNLRAMEKNGTVVKPDFQLGAQGPAQAAPPPGAHWRVSRMHLTFAALHEGDFFRVLDTLSPQRFPLMQVKRCTLQRSRSDQARGPAAQLAVECEIDWLSLRRGGTP